MFLDIDMVNIYWERQRGGLCRLHSINAYFGKPTCSDDAFYKAANEFDNIQKTQFGTTISCRTFDLINSDQRNLVSYILSKYGIYVRYVAINLHATHIEDAINSGCFFVFNLNHIWVMKKKDDQWYKVDSMSGVSNFNPTRLRGEKNIGIMIPIANLAAEATQLSKQIDIAIDGDVLNFLKINHAAKKILDNVEVYLGALVEILRVQLAGREGFVFIEEIIQRYNSFVRTLCVQHRYSDLAFLNANVPPILAAVSRLFPVSC